MACTLYVAWDGRLAGYDFGAGHPMAPARVELTIELARAFGLFAEAGVSGRAAEGSRRNYHSLRPGIRDLLPATSASKSALSRTAVPAR
jgi:hypothetical protein